MLEIKVNRLVPSSLPCARMFDPMESSSLLETETPPASVGRTSRVGGVVFIFCSTLGVIVSLRRVIPTTIAANAPIAGNCAVQ